MRTDKVLAIENLRLFLMALVVMHHAACTYAGPRLWYYQQITRDVTFFTLLTSFIAVNQSFFMGLFFLIAAYFTPASIKRRGTGGYVKERLVRLGLPLIVFFFVISPSTKFMATRHLQPEAIPLWHYLVTFQGIGFGPLWFVEALLYFTLAYTLGRCLWPSFAARQRQRLEMPGDAALFVFAVLTGTLSWIVRIRFPVGTALAPLSFQLPHFAQYILLFAAGIAAHRNQWLSAITFKRGLRWFLFAQLLIFIGAPVLLHIGGGFSGNLEPFYGGWHWQAFLYALWEQVAGMAMIMGLLGLFIHRFSHQPDRIKRLSESTYAVLILHAPILVGLSVAASGIRLDPFYKFIGIAPLAVVFSFAAAVLIRKIPLVAKVV